MFARQEIFKKNSGYERLCGKPCLSNQDNIRMFKPALTNKNQKLNQAQSIWLFWTFMRRQTFSDFHLLLFRLRVSPLSFVPRWENDQQEKE